MGCYAKEPTHTPTMTLKKALHEICGTKLDLKVGLPVMMVKELDSGVDVMYGCFTEGGDSILGVFSWELLQTIQVTSLLGS